MVHFQQFYINYNTFGIFGFSIKLAFKRILNMQWFSLVATIILWENQKTTSESQEVTGEKLHGTMSGYGNKSRLMVWYEKEYSYYRNNQSALN